jgi:acyl-CoA reductase-like NAD-dependent aldehyde dehydrogenase
VKKLMECGDSVIGGELDEDENYIAPTILVNITTSDAIMQEEVKRAIYLSAHEASQA